MDRRLPDGLAGNGLRPQAPLLSPLLLDALHAGGGHGRSMMLRRLMECSPHPFAVTGGSGHVLRSVNPAFCRVSGLAPEVMLGRRFGDVFSGASAAARTALLDDVFASGRAVEDHPISGGWASPHLGGIWSHTVWPLNDLDGGRLGLVLEVRDRTHDAQVQRRMEQMTVQMREVNERLVRAALQEQEWAEKAQAANRAKSDFLAMMSHELRTPINGIVGYADLMEAELHGPVNRAQRESLRRIKACSAHLVELIEDVLAFAQVEVGGATMRLEWMDLRELAHDAASIVEAVAAQKGLELRVETPDHAVTAEVDPQKVRQILLNLLGNAIKFTHEGEVCLDLEPHERGVRFRVKDTGIGISADEQERIFEPFVQAESVNTRLYGGTGLGLAISRALARMLGGDVVVHSAPGEGSRFLVEIPYSRAANTAE